MEDKERDGRVCDPGIVERRRDGGEGSGKEMRQRNRREGGATHKRGVRGEASLGTADRAVRSWGQRTEC